MNNDNNPFDEPIEDILNLNTWTEDEPVIHFALPKQMPSWVGRMRINNADADRVVGIELRAWTLEEAQADLDRMVVRDFAIMFPGAEIEMIESLHQQEEA
jgi:hypothetical protein